METNKNLFTAMATPESKICVMLQQRYTRLSYKLYQTFP